MSESFRTTPPDQPWSGSSKTGNGYQSGSNDRDSRESDDSAEAGKVVLVGVLGGLLSAAGLHYLSAASRGTEAASQRAGPLDRPAAH